jgi:hypothetical protein
MKLLLLFVFVIYIIVNWYVGNRIKNAYYLDEERRKLHLHLIWYLPFIGALIFKEYWTVSYNRNIEVMTKNKRHFKENIQSPGHYDSLY